MEGRGVPKWVQKLCWAACWAACGVVIVSLSQLKPANLDIGLDAFLVARSQASTPMNTKMTTVQPPRDASELYCWLVTASHGYELELVKENFRQERHIFGCDRSSVFTDNSSKTWPVPSKEIGPLKSEWALGDSLANTEVFLRAWDAVFAEELWARHLWTVKVDPSCVFMPERMSQHIQRQGWQTTEPVYIKNALNMLGPVEVFSFGAVAIMSKLLRSVCEVGMGTSGTGEDTFLDDCMGWLHMPTHIDSKLFFSLDDETKNRANSADCCRDDTFVGYHPYTQRWSYERCVELANRSDAGGIATELHESSDSQLTVLFFRVIAQVGLAKPKQ